jgi:UDP:flavonoid glycosyltransferase YjiC (YdhE family)
MARILFCWELGGASGHLAIIQTVAERLHALGHELHLAATRANMDRAAVFRASALPMTFHAMPAWRHSPRATRDVRTFAHILRNVGYSDPHQLAFQLRTWKTLLRTVRPDVLVCETSPTALLAAKDMDIATVVIGSGFSIPPRVYPLPDLRFWDPADARALGNDEDELTATINNTLAAAGEAPLSRLRDLFEATHTAICSVPELDTYSARPVERYVGEMLKLPGIQPPWPDAPKRVFAYLKTFPELSRFLGELLRRRDVCATIYAPGVPRSVIDPYRCARVCFVDQPVDVGYILRSASLVVTHGHGLTTQALRAGIPVLSFPLLLEQYILARRVSALGAGDLCSPWKSERIGTTLDALLEENSAFAQRAQQLASRYAHLDPASQSTQLAAHIGALAI